MILEFVYYIDSYFLIIINLVASGPNIEVVKR